MINISVTLQETLYSEQNFEHSNVRMVAQQPDVVAALKNVASQTSAILEVPPKDELLPADTTDKLFKGVAFVAFYGSQEKEGVSCGQKIHKDRFQGPGRLVMRFTEKRLGTSSIIVTGKDGHLRQYIMVGSWLYYAEQKYLHLNHGVPSSEGSSFSLIWTINEGADYSTEIVKICTALDTDTQAISVMKENGTLTKTVWPTMRESKNGFGNYRNPSSFTDEDRLKAGRKNTAPHLRLKIIPLTSTKSQRFMDFNKELQLRIVHEPPSQRNVPKNKQVSPFFSRSQIVIVVMRMRRKILPRNNDT